MTKLEMQIALQPLFKKMMGEIIFGDRIFLLKEGIALCSPFKANDENGKEHSFIHVCYHLREDIATHDISDVIRIPLPIDPVNPERGLWGMVDWNRYSCWLYGGKISIHSKDREEIEPRYLDPEEALLMALMEQENV
jgi:hypothetical protein